MVDIEYSVSTFDVACDVCQEEMVAVDMPTFLDRHHVIVCNKCEEAFGDEETDATGEP